MPNIQSSLSVSLIILFDFHIFCEPPYADASLIRRLRVAFLFIVNVPYDELPRCGYIFNGAIFGCSIRVGDETNGLGELRDNVPITSCGS